MGKRFCIKLTDGFSIGGDGRAVMKFTVAGAKNRSELEAALREMGYDDKRVALARSIISHAFSSDFFNVALDGLMGGLDHGHPSVSDLLTMARKNVHRVVEAMLVALNDPELTEYIDGDGVTQEACSK